MRLHMFFLLFAAFALYLGWRAESAVAGETFTVAALSIAILFVSVLLHEVGHLHAATYFGGGMDLMVIGPLGGLAPLIPPRRVRHEVIAHLAGPLVNLGVCVLCIVSVIFASAGEGNDALARSVSSPWGLLNPLQPQGLIGSNERIAMLCLRLGVWINWVLFLVNLLPAFPFDGARALRAALSEVWRRDGRRRAARIVSWIAQVTASAMVIAGVCLAVFGESDATAPTTVPPWFALALLGIVLFFSAQRDASSEDSDRASADDYQSLDSFLSESGYDRYEGIGEAAEEASQATLTQLREERRAARLRRQRELEEADDQRVDEILARLHEDGMQSLTPDDKALLERVSARYRNRDRHRA